MPKAYPAASQRAVRATVAVSFFSLVMVAACGPPGSVFDPNTTTTTTTTTTTATTTTTGSSATTTLTATTGSSTTTTTLGATTTTLAPTTTTTLGATTTTTAGPATTTTTSSTSSTSSSTTSTTSTTLQVVNYNVTFGITTDVGLVGGLGLDISFTGSSGDFVGDAGAVNCSTSIPSALALFNKVSPGNVTAGFIDATGFSTPVDVATCLFASTGVVLTTSFTVLVTEATDTAPSPIVPTPTVVATGVSAVP